MRAARSWGRSHSELIAGSNGWNDVDRSLALALVAYEDSLCPCGCGYPRDRVWDDDADGWFEVEQVTCYARAALDRRRDARTEVDPGRLEFAVDGRDTDGGSVDDG